MSARDIAYSDDAFIHLECATEFCYEKTWNEYMNLMQPLAAETPYMVTPGNHEAECHSPACLLDADRREALRNFTAYNARFRMPSPESNGVLNMWSSFNYGPVTFISIDTETSFPLAPEEHQYVLPCGGFGDMLSWLEQQLIEANKERHLRPWIMVASHHPLYFGGHINQPLQDAVEELFYKYKVCHGVHAGHWEVWVYVCVCVRGGGLSLCLLLSHTHTRTRTRSLSLSTSLSTSLSLSRTHTLSRLYSF